MYKPCKQWDKLPYQLVSRISSINSTIPISSGIFSHGSGFLVQAKVADPIDEWLACQMLGGSRGQIRPNSTRLEGRPQEMPWVKRWFIPDSPEFRLNKIILVYIYIYIFIFIYIYISYTIYLSSGSPYFLASWYVLFTLPFFCRSSGSFSMVSHSTGKTIGQW